MRKQMIGSFTTILIVLLSCFFTAPIWAYVLDATFGEDGVVTTSVDHFGDAAKAVIIDKNNKILVAGVSDNGSNLDFSLARYHENGTLDKSFDYDGVVTTQIGSNDDQAQAIALQENGKIIVAGYAFNGLDNDFALVRYHSDGSLDLEFGLDGIAVLPIGHGNDLAHAVAVQVDGSILIAGSSVAGSFGTAAAIVRLLENGAVDQSFGSAGVVLSANGRGAVIRDLLLQENGSILVTGQYKAIHAEEDKESLLLMRYLPDGRPDPEFGLAGAVDTSVYPVQTAGTSICLQENGAILIAGAAGSGNKQDIALFRFLPHGQYDPTFGQQGMVVRDLNHEADGAYDVVATPSGIVVGGYTTINGLRDFVLLKYSYTGMPVQDSAADEKSGLNMHIGEPGIAKNYSYSASKNPEIKVTTTSISSFDDTGYGLAVQKDNKIILVGASGDEGLNNYALARYTSSDTVPAVKKSSGSSSAFVITTEVTEITRNSALTGGTILTGSGLTFTSRGVVYSIAPFPILLAGNEADGDGDGGDGDGDGGDGDGDGGDGDGDGGDGDGSFDDVGPVQSAWSPTGTLPAGITEVTLTVNTNVPAECRYDDFKENLTFDTMTNIMTSSSGALPVHTAKITGLTDGGTNVSLPLENYVFTIRCKDPATGIANEKNHNVPFAVGVTANMVKAFTGTPGSQSKYIKIPKADTEAPAKETTLKAEVTINEKAEAGSGVGPFSVILTELSIGTRYYVRAYGVTSTGTVVYGNQLNFETKDSCFIATAAYGSLAHPHVQILRNFRDQYLKPFVWGRKFIDSYYHYSPALAQVIEQHPLLQPAVRLLLQPVIGAGYILIHIKDYWLLLLSSLTGLILLSSLLRLRTRKPV